MKKTTINTILMAIIALMSISICFLIFCIATRPHYVTVNEPDSVIITEDTTAIFEEKTTAVDEEANTDSLASLESTQNNTMRGKTSSRVNIRNGPSTDSKVLITVDADTIFDIIEIQDNGWTKILYEGGEAYISSDYVIIINGNE